MPTRLISSVRGIGVAVRVITSTFVFICFIASLCCTPKRCSSSTTRRPRSLKTIDGLSSRWVPMTQSTLTDRRPSMTTFACAAVRNLLSTSTRIGKPANRSANVLPCCVASSVVGASTATCLPSWIALNAARIATSVLPNPTSPQTRRSIGYGRSISSFTASIADLLVRRLDVAERVLHVGLPRGVAAECMPGGVNALLVQDHEFLGNLAHRRANGALRLGEVGSAEAVDLRRFAADVLAQRVDLVARHVELVAPLVGEEQVVALDASDAALDHSFVLTDAVDVVDDVVADVEVLEHRRALARPGAGAAMGAATTGEIRFGHDRQTCVGQRHTTMEGGDDDVAAGNGEIGRFPSPWTVNSRPWSASRAASRSADPTPSAATTTR